MVFEAIRIQENRERGGEIFTKVFINFNLQLLTLATSTQYSEQATAGECKSTFKLGHYNN